MYTNAVHRPEFVCGGSLTSGQFFKGSFPDTAQKPFVYLEGMVSCTCHDYFYIQSRFKLTQASWTFFENRKSKVQAFSRTLQTSWNSLSIFEVQLISYQSTRKVNSRLESLESLDSHVLFKRYFSYFFAIWVRYCE